MTSSWSAESFLEAVDGKRRNKANLTESSWNQRPIMMNPVARISLLRSAAFVPPRRRTETDRCGAARVGQAANSKIRFGFVMTKQTQFRRTPVESTADCRSTNDRAAGGSLSAGGIMARVTGSSRPRGTSVVGNCPCVGVVTRSLVVAKVWNSNETGRISPLRSAPFAPPRRQAVQQLEHRNDQTKPISHNYI